MSTVPIVPTDPAPPEHCRWAGHKESSRSSCTSPCIYCPWDFGSSGRWLLARRLLGFSRRTTPVVAGSAFQWHACSAGMLEKDRHACEFFPGRAVVKSLSPGLALIHGGPSAKAGIAVGGYETHCASFSGGYKAFKGGA